MGGYPLLMVMGFSFSLLDWGDVLPDELAKHYQVILFDNRDSGRTKSQSIEALLIRCMILGVETLQCNVFTKVLKSDKIIFIPKFSNARIGISSDGLIKDKA
ncbi:alpha/beta fold hydrolase [Nostoc sp.]|uniref:alpha/beta fold hydrolase n=2 Tax=Nostoc sp. TaxID=1180 RepID=UPI002FF764EC